MTRKQLKDWGLTEQQVDAVSCKLGPILVVAGAGSGKTTVMAHRCLYLNYKLGIELERILCVTFTRQAVSNLKKKLKHVLERFPTDMYTEAHVKVPVMTFHALCKSFLQDVYAKNNESEVKFLHQSKIMNYVKKIMEAYPHITAISDTTELIMRMRRICKSKHRTFTEDELLQEAIRLYNLPEGQLKTKFPYSDMQEIYDKLDKVLKDSRHGTLDDIIIDAYNHLSDDEELLEGLCSRYDAILCDEFQDVDDIQFELLTKLSKNHHNLFCVGDPEQAIFGFRGAVPRIFTRLRKYFDEAAIFTQLKKLETNFRSTPQILRVANELINACPTQDDLRKNLITSNDSGPKPTLSVLSTPKQQAQEVVLRIRQLQNEGASLDNIVVLGRNKSHYKTIKDAFMRMTIPFVDWRDIWHTYMDCAEIKDLLNCLGVAFIRDDEKRWSKCLRRICGKMKVGVGSETWGRLSEDGPENTFANIQKYSMKKNNVDRLYQKIRRLREIADNTQLPMKERCREIAESSGLMNYYSNGKVSVKRNRIETIMAFLNSEIIAQSRTWDEAFSKVVSFMQDDDRKLVCSTIHGVKGLEFDHVLVVSLSQDNLPSKRGLQQRKTPDEEQEYVEEERRLLYVAITRAKKTLHLFSDKPEERWCPFFDDVINALDRRRVSKLASKIPQEQPENEIESESTFWEDFPDQSLEVEE